jgi:preprotein translocase subunit SecF
MINKRFIFYSIAIVLGFFSLITFFIFPLNLGIDLQGGYLIEVKTAFPEIKNNLKIKGDIIKTSNSIIIKSKEIDKNQLLTEIKKYDSQAEIIRYENISPSLSKELTRKSITAIILVLLAIGSYVAIVFREKSGLLKSWLLGLIVILTLFHDLLISFGIYNFLSYWYNFEFNISIIVALLIITGFSVHDTIVVFDRLRENVKKSQKLSIEVFNLSVQETLSRSINTSLTAILAILPLAFLIDLLRPFIVLIIIGFVVGTYSSICLALSLAYDFLRKIKK